MKKRLIATLTLVALLCIIAISLVACDKPQPVAEDTTFVLEVRKYNGVTELGVAKLDGELLASKTIEVKAGQITVSEALAEIAPLQDGAHKIELSETDYLLFTETPMGYSTSWYLSDGHFDAVPEYTSGDFQWSYMSFNDHYSNGVTQDFLDGLKVYTIVIDGYDGHTGSDPAWE